MNITNTLKNDWHDDPSSLDISYTYRNIIRCFSVIAPKNVHNTFPSLFTQDSSFLDYFAIYKDNYIAICKVVSILMSQNLTDNKNWP